MRNASRLAVDCAVEGTPDAVRREGRAVRWDVLALLAVAVLIGVGIRTYQLLDQVLVDDEWHAVHKLIWSGYLSIATDLGANDHCIPLTLLYRLMADTIGLSELRMRVPSLLAGTLALVLAPLLSMRFVGARAAVLLAGLLAVSPFHVFLSRLARPYGIVALCGGVGLPCFWSWWQTNDRRARGVFMACAVLGVSFHLSCAPLFFAAPVAAWVVVRRARRPTAVELAVVLGGVALVVGVLLGPALVDNGALASKLGRGAVGLETASGSLRLLFGSAHPALLAVLIGLGIAGLWSVRGAAARYARFLALCCAAEVLALMALHPTAAAVPIVFTRYGAGALVPMLTLLAVGIVGVEAALQRRFRYRAPIVATSTLLVVVALGPLRTIYYFPNDFTNSAALQADYDPHGYFERFRPAVISDFYRRLAESRRGSLLIVEAPWFFYWHSYPYLQRIHKQRVMIGGIDRRRAESRSGELPDDARFRGFRNLVNVGDYAMLTRRRVDYVVFHKAEAYETRSPFDDAPVDVRDWVTEYALLFGPAAYEDDYVVAFDVLRPTARR